LLDSYDCLIINVTQTVMAIKQSQQSFFIMKKTIFIPMLFLFAICLLIACGTTKSTTTKSNDINQGYGSISNKKSTTAVSQTEVGDAASGDISWMQLFQKTSGLTVRGSGRNLSIQIRSKKSMTAGHEPLFIVDGQIRGNGFENISFIDPAEVRRISVLKDAASAAAYGSRGANGVILVTLK